MRAISSNQSTSRPPRDEDVGARSYAPPTPWSAIAVRRARPRASLTCTWPRGPSAPWPTRSHRVLLQLDQPAPAAGPPASFGQSASAAELVPHAGHPLPQRGGRPHRRRGRVVELVGQPGTRARRGPAAARVAPITCVELLSGAEEQPLEQVHRPSGTTRASSSAKVVRGQHEERGVGETARMVAVVASARRRSTEVGLGRAPKYAPRLGAARVTSTSSGPRTRSGADRHLALEGGRRSTRAGSPST